MFALTSPKHKLSSSSSQICAHLATLKAYLDALPCCVFHNRPSSQYFGVKLETVMSEENILKLDIPFFLYSKKRQS